MKQILIGINGKDGICMYKVYCQGGKYARWQPYSNEYESREDAEQCKKQAENLISCDVYGNLIRYKIVELQD